jgi:hypothetical protein
MTLRRGPSVSEKTGAQATLPLVITEHASTPCVLDGYPALVLVDGRDRVLPFQYTHRGDEMITGALPKPVPMRTGTSSYFALNKTGCDVRATHFARTLRVRLAGARHAESIRLQHTRSSTTADQDSSGALPYPRSSGDPAGGRASPNGPASGGASSWYRRQGSFRNTGRGEVATASVRLLVSKSAGRAPRPAARKEAR